MSFQEFLTKYNGKFVEVAGSVGAENQCVDLANAYIRDVLELPIIEWTNAKDFPAKAGSNYEYILNTPMGIPQEGDLIVWRGVYGHIAIFIEGNADSFRSFDQNYPTGSNSHVQNHNYNNVLGWLRPKNQSDCGAELNKCIADRNRNWDYLISIADLLQKETNVTVIKEEIKKLMAYEYKVIEKEKQLKEANEEILVLRKQLNEISNINEEIKVENELLGDKVTELKGKSESQEDSIKIMEGKIEELEQSTEESSLNGLALIWKGMRRILRGR
uniref:Peptidase C51 domain-containing protein n=2 Tax=viral metagenome TaxID=1070528 RepID=A0A6M3IHH4_9ZZZZ